MPCSSHAQQAKYTTAAIGDNINIAGRFNNNIHVWSTSVPPWNFSNANTILTLHVFSDQLNLVNEHRVLLGKVFINSLDFQLGDTAYYANITYSSTSSRRLLLKVDHAGNITNSTSSPGLWANNSLNGNAKMQGPSIQYRNSLFFVHGVEIAGDSSGNTLLTSEPLKPKKILQKIIIAKAGISDVVPVASYSFASAFLDFFRPIIAASADNMLISAVFARANSSRHNPYKGNYLAITRLDTNLAILNKPPALLRISRGNKNETYSPLGIYQLDKNLLIISKGESRKFLYSYGGRSNGVADPPTIYSTYITTSLRIMLIDEQHHFLQDTIIESKAGRESLNFGNLLVLAENKGADIFCSHKYAGSKNGVTHLSMDSDGHVIEKAMIVDEDYSYALTGANKLEKGVLLIPFRYRRTRGLMKLMYQPAN